MKKQVLLLVVLFCIIEQAAAQDKQVFKRFGVRAGANFSHINFAKGSPPPAVPIKTSWSAGITIGFLLAVPLNDQFSLQPEYLYSGRGGEIKGTGEMYTLNYLSLPLLLKYRLHEKFSLMAGPQFDVLINAKKTVNGNSAKITHDTEERSLGAVGGIEYHFTEALSVCARYMHGLNHIGLGQRSNIQEFKYEMLQVSVSIAF